jgi:hypothetical protein
MPPPKKSKSALADAPAPASPPNLAAVLGPNPPHSQRLQIVRAAGGYILFSADVDFDQADADPADAVAVASTPQELVRHVDAWANALPPESFPA